MDISRSNQNQPADLLSESERHARNGRIITLVIMIMAIPSAILFGYVGFYNNLPQLYIISAALIASAIFDLYPLALIRSGRTDRAMTIIIFVFNANILIVPFLVDGLGAIIAASAIVVTMSIAGLALSSKYSSTGIGLGIFFGIIALLIDLLFGGSRIHIPQLGTYSTYIAAAISIPIFVMLAREFNKFNLQAKITLGILITGAVTVATLLFFGLNRTNLIVETLSQKLESNSTEQTESQILNVIQKESEKANSVFSEAQKDMVNIAEYRTRLENQSYLFSSGEYWNAGERIRRLPSGQYGNSRLDPSSIFIPNNVVVDEAMLADINTTAYLDFMAPSFLKSHPEVVALYYISKMGYTTYYPNIALAENVPADFNPTEQPFYTIATPENNPEHEPRWTEPYQDPAGTGLIVTLTTPIYSSVGTFKGVMGADIQLAKVSNEISKIQFGQSGYAFLVDKNGRVISMPRQGYDAFGLQPEEIPVNESPKLSLFDSSVDSMQVIAQGIVASEPGLMTANIRDTENYIAVAPLETMEYRLVAFAPVDELNSEIIATRSEIENEIQSSLRSAGAILITLFIGALIISFWVGRIITRPMNRLTKTVEEIASGNIAARVEVESQ
ncbi:MAG: HAMP domain-containing protein, partial [Anaerolineales bacterium]|nr:HAMP domain-containing protein [Anaerolineales bacterium]